MRLLNKKEIQDIKITVDKQNDALVNASSRKIKEFQDSIAKIKSILEQKQNETAIFITNAEKEKQILLNEVASLENRRQELLKPITTELAILEAKRVEIDTIYSEIEKKESGLSLWRYKLDHQGNDLDLRTAYLEAKEHRAKNYAERNERTSQSLSQTESELNKKQQELNDYSNVENTVLDIKRKEIDQDLKYVSTMKIELENQRIDILNREKSLENKQLTLKMAFEEAKKKGII